MMRTWFALINLDKLRIYERLGQFLNKILFRLLWLFEHIFLVISVLKMLNSFNQEYWSSLTIQYVYFSPSMSKPLQYTSCEKNKLSDFQNWLRNKPHGKKDFHVDPTFKESHTFALPTRRNQVQRMICYLLQHPVHDLERRILFRRN